MSGDVEHNSTGTFRFVYRPRCCDENAAFYFFFSIETDGGATSDGLPQREKWPCNQWGPLP